MDTSSHHSSNSSTWGLALSNSASSDGRTDPEADYDSTEAAVSAPFPPCTREQLYSQLQGLQEELYHIQELQQVLRMAEQSNCSGCSSGYGHSSVDFAQASGVPWKPSPVSVQPLQQQLQQQQMQMMQMQQQLDQIQQTLPRGSQPLAQAPWRPAVIGASGSSSSRSPVPMHAEDMGSTRGAPHKKAVLQPQTPDKPFYNEHGVDLMKLSDSELEKVVPLNANGERTSIGALQHPDKCSRCIFWFRNICEKGIRCEFCHFAHPGQIAKKIRPSKSVRLKQKEQEKKEAA